MSIKINRIKNNTDKKTLFFKFICEFLNFNTNMRKASGSIAKK